MPPVENDAHYREILARINALEALIARLYDVQAEAVSERALGRLTDDDVRDVGDAGALGDAIANLSYTLGHLKSDAAEWEEFAAYSKRYPAHTV